MFYAYVQIFPSSPSKEWTLASIVPAPAVSVDISVYWKRKSKKGILRHKVTGKIENY